MKKIILFVLGLIPFGLSFLMNSWMMSNQDSVLPLKLIGILFIAFWIFIGFITSEFAETPLKSSIIVNTSAFLVLLLLLYQEIIQGYYWANSLIGIGTQFYFLPLINLSSFINRLTPFVWVTYIIAFIIMFASYNLGAYLKKHNRI